MKAKAAVEPLPLVLVNYSRADSPSMGKRLARYYAMNISTFQQEQQVAPEPTLPPEAPQTALEKEVQAIANRIIGGDFQKRDLTCHRLIYDLKARYTELGVAGVTLESLYKSLDAMLPEPKAEPTPAKKVADYICSLAEIELFHDAQRLTYITTPQGTLPLDSLETTRWIINMLDEEQESIPGPDSINAAVGILDSRAAKGQKIETSIRVAHLEHSLLIDIGDDTFDIVEVSGGEWKIVPADRIPSEIRFVRAAGMLPLPRPEKGGSLEGYRALVNVANEDAFALFKIFLIGCFWKGPYAIGNVEGPPGSGKSWFAHVLRQSVDPSTVPLSMPSRNTRDLAISCANSYVLTGDNLSKIPLEMSDARCGVSTGSGFRTRSLYTNRTELLLTYCRPQIFTGIGDFARQPDYMDRSLFWRLVVAEPGAERTIDELKADFEAKRARLFGAILDVLVAALTRMPAIRTRAGFRLADAMTFALAAAPALGLSEDSVIRICRENQRGAMQAVIESDSFATALFTFMKKSKLFTGSYEELLTKLIPDGKRIPKDWPDTPRGVRARLDMLKKPLESGGISWESGKRSEKSAPRKIILSFSEPQNETISAADVANMAEGSNDAPL